jgi:uncharacterized membrane protein YhaH (DUF805 family)
MLDAIKYNLTHVADFRGRDARQTFWYYVLFLFIIQVVAGMAMAIPMIVSIFRGIIAASQAGVTDQQQVAAMMTAQVGGFTQNMLPFSLGLSLVLMLLFVAALVRRLHDSGKPGWWALLPVATQVFSMGLTYSTIGKLQAVMSDTMTDPQAAMHYQREVAPYSLISWVGYIAVIVFGIMKSTEGPNRYGEAPVEF